MVSVLTGLRRGELRGIRWRNVDFEKKLINVEYQRVQISTGSIEKVPKGGKDDGGRDEIIAFIDKTITAKLKIPDMRV